MIHQTLNPPSDLKIVEETLENLRLKHWLGSVLEDVKLMKPAEAEALLGRLKKWGAIELAARNNSAIQRRIKASNFIKTQTIDQFDFQYNKSTRAIEPDLMKLYHDTRQGKLPRAVFVGNTGLGKTHLARALGYAACQAGISVMFIKATEIVNRLATAKATHTLERELRKYCRPRLLVCDELGYVAMDTESGNLFFQAISARHDRDLGTIVTTNYPFSHWNQIFAGDSTALVTVERLTAYAEVFYLEGKSYPQTQREKRNQEKRK